MVEVRAMDRREVTTTRAMESKVAMVATRVMATRAMDSNKAMDNSLGMVSNKAMVINQVMVIIKATPRRKVDTRVGTIISMSTRMLRAAPSTRRRRSPRTLPATRAQAG